VKFPAVGVDQVLGFLKVVHHLGGRADVMYINDAVDADLGDLSHVVDAAEALGLVKFSGGDVELTPEGRRAVESPVKNFQQYLRNKLISVEPFRQLVEYVAEVKSASVEEVLEFIESLGYGEEDARKILDWAVFAQLVEIDGEEVKLA